MTDENKTSTESNTDGKNTYSPPTLHAVQMRKDRYGLKYPSPLGSARPDKDGFGDLMRLQAHSLSGFMNIMTDEKLKSVQAKYKQDRAEIEKGRGRE